MLPALPALGRAAFGIPEGPLVFLYIFDVSSQTERKNPLAAIRAFRRAALPHEAAVLVLKFTNPGIRPGRRPPALRGGFRPQRRLRRSLSRSAPTSVALINTADCYLSPHRAEGFGLTLLEAMRLGKPVIGTAYSGNMDFMTPDNSYLLDYSLVTLTRDYGPYFRGAVWADPDVEHAARLIRDVVHNRSEAALRGARARADVERDWNPVATGRAVRDRLEAVRAGRRLEVAP